MVSDWRKRGPVYEVPFSTLCGKKVKNLLAAGRCTSVTDGTMGRYARSSVLRRHGRGGGTCRLLIADDFSSIDVSALQAGLSERGVKLHEKELTR